MNTLFTPITLGGLTLDNRIIIPPMDQYSAEDGHPGEWHCMHYGHLAVSGAGMLIVEATAIEAAGRISPGDLGLWDERHEESHRKMIKFIRKFSKMPLAVQLAHAGRKASTAAPWEGRGVLEPDEGGWAVCAPSAERYDPDSPQPAELSGQDIRRLTGSFVEAAKRAISAGYDAIELHAAHGYLIHEFLSPLSNKRKDQYGGSLQNRMRFALEVFKDIRSAVQPDVPVGVRVSGTDFAEGGWNIKESVELARELEKLGCAYIHVSGGGLSPDQSISLAPGYQVPLAERVKKGTNLPTIAVGLITEPELAASVIFGGQADMVAIGRGMLFNPRWPWHAAASLGETVKNVPNQYLRSNPRRFKSLFSK